MKKSTHTALGALAGAALASIVTLASVPHGAENDKPGTERWKVKTLQTSDASRIMAMVPQSTTVEELTSLSRPSTLPEDTRALEEERRVILTATCYACKLEADGDFHLALRGSSGATMIAEVPRPDENFIGRDNPAFASISAAREAIELAFHPNERIKKIAVPVMVGGPIFFDFQHHQLGVAKNAVEIHPVLSFAVGKL